MIINLVVNIIILILIILRKNIRKIQRKKKNMDAYRSLRILRIRIHIHKSYKGDT